jgi:hypothetical protein
MTEEILTVVAIETATVAAAVETATAAEVSEAATVAPGKCTRLPVLTVVLRLKFRSNQQRDGRFTVETAFLITEDSNYNLH